MLGDEETEDINDPLAQGVTIGNSNESLRLGLLMLTDFLANNIRI